jgi:hypothetical protein
LGEDEMADQRVHVFYNTINRKLWFSQVVDKQGNKSGRRARSEGGCGFVYFLHICNFEKIENAWLNKIND